MPISDSVEGGPSVIIKMARFSNLVFLLFIAIVTVCIVAAGFILLNKALDNPTHKFLLPKGFTGWVEVTFEQPGFPPLKREGLTIIYEVPPSGKVMTASKNVSGTMVLNYVEQDGRLIELPTDAPMIHGQHTSGGSITGPDGQAEMLPGILTFFVGTEEQWREAMEKQPVR
jgi:hypothetical protein